MFFSLFIENLAIAFISRTKIPGFADFIVTVLNPIYEFFINFGL